MVEGPDVMCSERDKPGVRLGIEPFSDSDGQNYGFSVESKALKNR